MKITFLMTTKWRFLSIDFGCWYIKFGIFEKF